MRTLTRQEAAAKILMPTKSAIDSESGIRMGRGFEFGIFSDVRVRAVDRHMSLGRIKGDEKTSSL
jgi:hypothetical protein